MSNFIFFVTCLLSIAVSLCSSTTTLAQGIPRPPYPPKELAGVTLFLLGNYYRDSIVVYCQDSLIFKGNVETMNAGDWPKVIPMPHVSPTDTSVSVKIVLYSRRNYLLIFNPDEDGIYTAYSDVAKYKDAIISNTTINVSKQGRYIIYNKGDKTNLFEIRSSIPRVCSH